ncbi:MAG: DUF2748 family protein [Rickettsiales bacterium]
MASNLYHLLHFLPGTRAWEMPRGLEALAQQLVQSGKLRISADHERNFVRLGTTDSDHTFTARELTDPALRARTYAQLARHVAPAAGEAGLQALHQRLLKDLKIARGIAPDKEIKVARVLVQATHPAVIALLLKTGAELFVSYAHNVGELMPVHTWANDTSTASGLQATGDEGAAVYVSCGGDPFFEGEHKTYTTDGFDALARMVVIAGQELGHFADLRRMPSGQVVGRYSCDPHASQLRAHPTVRDGRVADMQRVAQLEKFYVQAGLAPLRRAEKGVAFYHTRWRYTPPWFFYQLLRGVAWVRFAANCRMHGQYRALRTVPYHRHGEAVELWLADMAFNLAPDADVYRNADPLVEEAIACIEALARVPQQVNKWGHMAVSVIWPALYRVYYQKVIPAAISQTGMAENQTNMSVLQLVILRCRRLLEPRPDYYPARRTLRPPPP